MQSLASAKFNVKKGTLYTKPLRLKVVAASADHEYQPDKRMKSMGLADAYSTVRASMRRNSFASSRAMVSS